MKFFRLIFLLILFSPLLQAQQISYIIPDIVTRDMNSYFEIIGPEGAKGNFGSDAFYMNNPGDSVRVVCANLADTNKITFGPLIVSWNGRMISTQAFVNPKIDTSSWTSDWTTLPSQYKIPIKVQRLGVSTSTIDTIYIVKPFHFPAKTAYTTENSLGGGSLGKRSRRGAMIVDSMDLKNSEYIINMGDCDPYTPGNQAYLPFTLYSIGNVTGGASAVINANHAGKYGGAGGGGGGGGFGDYAGVGTSGGDGYSGGGPGGHNSSDYYLNGGDGTLSDGVNGSSSDYGGMSISRVNGGSHGNAHESAGGGTGHPFGSSGIGCYDGGSCGNTCGYGGGGGDQQNTQGGNAGHTIDAPTIYSVNNTNGKAVGNIYCVPISGGSGGASANPKGSLVASSGAGGGGGGAINFFANKISSLKFTVKGSDGISGSNAPNGGAGSGGMVVIATKMAIDNINAMVDGGSGASYGRVRAEARKIIDSSGITPSAAFQFKGLVTDTNRYLQKTSFILPIYAFDSAQVRLFIKPLTGVWTEITNIPFSPMPTLKGVRVPTIDLSAYSTVDSTFYLVAMKQNPNPSSADYVASPKYVFSQGAANILNVLPMPKIACDTMFKDTLINCAVALDTFAINIQDTGKAALNITSLQWKNGGKGFSFSPATLSPIAPNSTDTLSVFYKQISGQSGIIRDTLLVYHNDISRNNPREIIFEIALVDLDIEKWNQAMTAKIDSLDFGSVCAGTDITRYFGLMNRSFAKQNLTFSLQNGSIFSLIKDTLAIDAHSAPQFEIKANLSSQGSFSDKLIIKVKGCPSFSDTLFLKITSANFDGLEKWNNILSHKIDTLDFGEICVGASIVDSFYVKNTSNANYNFNYRIEKGVDYASAKSKEPINAIGKSAIAITATANKAGDNLDKLIITIDECSDYSDTLYLKIKGVYSDLVLSGNGDFGNVDLGKSKTTTLTLTNNGTAKAYLRQIAFISVPFRVDSVKPAPFDTLYPGKSISIYVSFSPTKEQDYSDLIQIFTLSVGGACRDKDTDQVQLKGTGVNAHLVCFPNSLDYGLVANCQTKIDSITLISKGIAKFTIDSIYILPSSAYYTILSPSSQVNTMNPNDSLVVKILFNPSAPPDGIKTAQLIVKTDDDSISAAINIQGERYGVIVNLVDTIDFGSHPIPTSLNQAVKLTNKSKGAINIKTVASTNSDFTFSPTTGNIAVDSNKSVDFTIMANILKAGPNSGYIKFYIDSPCPYWDSIFVKYNGLEGEASYSTSLNMGGVPYCESKKDSIIFRNIGDAPIEFILPMTITNTPIFDFCDAMNANQTAPAKDSIVRYVCYNAQADVANLQSASVSFSYIENGTTKNGNISITAQRMSPSASIKTKDFGSIFINDNAIDTLKLYNNGAYTFEIESVIHSSEFVQTNFALPQNLAVSDSFSIPLSFTPLDTANYIDTIKIVRKFYSCLDTISVVVKGTGSFGAIAYFYMDSTNAEPTELNLSLPVWAYIDYSADSTLSIDSISATISVNRDVFYPLSANSGAELLSQDIIGDNKIAKLEALNVKLSRTPRVIFNLAGATLLGETMESALKIDTIIHHSKKISKVVLDSGKLVLNICKEGGNRLISSKKLALALLKYNEGYIVNATPNEIGESNLELYDVSGKKYSLLKRNIASLGEEISYYLSADAYPSGVYLIVFRTPNNMKQEKIYIIN